MLEVPPKLALHWPSMCFQYSRAPIIGKYNGLSFHSSLFSSSAAAFAFGVLLPLHDPSIYIATAIFAAADDHLQLLLLLSIPHRVAQFLRMAALPTKLPSCSGQGMSAFAPPCRYCCLCCAFPMLSFLLLLLLLLMTICCCCCLFLHPPGWLKFVQWQHPPRSCV